MIELRAEPDPKTRPANAAEAVAGLVLHDTMDVIARQIAVPLVVLAEEGRTTNFVFHCVGFKI